jgi:apolipoprotein N-acyltransferase
MLVRFAHLSPLLSHVGLLLFSAFTAVPLGFWAVAVALDRTTGWRSVAWAACSYVAAAALWPALFPFTNVIGLASWPVWIQAAELGGVPLCEALVVVAGVLLGEALLTGNSKNRIRLGLAGLMVPVLVGALGKLRMDAIDAEAADAPHVRFGVVQPNTALFYPSKLVKVERLRTGSQVAQRRGAQLVLWPEAGPYPHRVSRSTTSDFPGHRRRILLRHQLPTIFGAASYDEGSRWDYNTVFNMSVDGRILGHFDKVNLMPFGEYVPIVDPKWAQSYIPAMAHNLAGEGPVRFQVSPVARTDGRWTREEIFVGPLVCYEDIFPFFARDVARLPGGIHAFVNLTIDAWFGVTSEPWEHLALAQFRSVEHRIPMLRSVSTGVSAAIDPAGRLVATLPAWGSEPADSVPPQVIVEDLPVGRNTAEKPTIYARVGWLFPWCCTLVVMVVVLARLRRRVQAGRPKGPS